MASVDVSRNATRGLPALKSALCALAKFALPTPSLLHNPVDWPAMIAEVVQDAYTGLAGAGQDEVARGALSLAVQRLGKLQLISGSDDKVGPSLKTVWKELAAEQPPAAMIRFKDFRLYLAGLTERFLAQRVHKSTGKTIKSIAALKSQVQLRTALGLEPDAVESCRLSVREVAALLKDAGVEVPPSCAAALVLRLAGGGSQRRPAQKPRGAGGAAEETLLRYVQVERALVSSLSDAALNLLLSRRRAAPHDGATAAGTVISHEPPRETRPPLPPPAPSPERATSRSWRTEREAAKASERDVLERAQQVHGSLHSPEQCGESNPEALLDSHPQNPRRASREGLGIDAENEFVQYVSLERHDGPHQSAAYATSSGMPSPQPPPVMLSRLQWLQKVQAQAAQAKQAKPARLLGSSDRRDLEHAWLGLGEEELAFPLERPWPLERPQTPLPPFEQDASDAAPLRLSQPPLRLTLPSKSPRATDFKNIHV